MTTKRLLVWRHAINFCAVDEVSVHTTFAPRLPNANHRNPIAMYGDRDE
jgi:hypothetical protein